MLDLREGEPESSSLPDERQQRQHVARIASVTGRLPTRQENSARFVQPKRLAAQAGLRGDLPDQQPVTVHETNIEPAPWGKVNGAATFTCVRSAVKRRDWAVLTFHPGRARR